MNPESDMDNPVPPDASGRIRDGEPPPPANWREALLALVSSRIALIQLESKDAARDAGGRLARWVAVLFCAFFTWALFLAGSVALIAKTAGWPWHGVALAAAALHLLAAVILAKSAKTPAAPSFPVTRAEFQKDREWIENFQKTRKSSD